MPHELTWVNSKLLGLECWGAFLLPSSPVLHLALGDKIPDTSRGAHKLLPEDRFTPEYALMVECPWRLDLPNRVVTGWMDYTDGYDSPMAIGIERLYGKRIIRSAVTRPAMDLTLRFQGNYSLRIFSSTSLCHEEQDAWSLFHHRDGLLVSIGPRGQWSTDKSRVPNDWQQNR